MALLKGLQAKVMVVEKKEKPYEIEGRTGISYKVRIAFPWYDQLVVKIGKDIYDQLEEGKSYDILIGFDILSGGLPKIHQVL